MDPVRHHRTAVRPSRADYYGGGGRPADPDDARQLAVRNATVSKWRTRFVKHGLPGLQDELRPGAPKRYDEETEHRIIDLASQDPPPGNATWTAELLAEMLKDVSMHHVWRVLRQHDIHLQRRRSHGHSTDPEFTAKAADVVGLYLQPPENAIILCIDEKPHIQALERAQGVLRLPSGKALTGYSHQYKRHGKTTLIAALEVATGLVKAGHYARRRRREFLDFMNDVIADYPDDQEIHGSWTTSTPTSPNTIGGVRAIPTCTSTSRRPAPPGST